MMDGQRCLLHPIVTCLAQEGTSFFRPLLLRFPVGDLESMVSGSDSGDDDEDEETYRLYLMKQSSPLAREEGSSVWVLIKGDIMWMENGVYLMDFEVKVFHVLLTTPLDMTTRRQQWVRQYTHNSRCQGTRRAVETFPCL